MPVIKNIENGYLLEHIRVVSSFIRNVIYKYYIFLDGTAIIMEKEVSNDINMKSDV